MSTGIRVREIPDTSADDIITTKPDNLRNNA